MTDLQNLANQFGLDPRSETLLRMAFEGAVTFEPSVPRSAILFDRAIKADDETKCEGNWRPIPAGVAIPNLSWIRFNDRTISVRVLGSLMLTKDQWFRGPRLFLSGWPLTCIPLWEVNFDKTASSAISV